MLHVCVILADGFEEVEAITPVDYLRRAGFAVKMAALERLEVEGAHGIRVLADVGLADVADDPFDVIIVPGGLGGAQNIAADDNARAILKKQFQSDRFVAALCAAPALVLGEACKLLAGRKFTCYPGMEKHVTEGTYTGETLCLDGKLITAAGPACAQAFALGIIHQVMGEAAAGRVAQAILAEPAR
ncbi:MAG: DJ-1/PfpI family protein [Spirochaetes bacterium]|nr:DJ-1/PfpI family protein [Spirochaetota bacterium]MBU0955294.1 DJ-1/PfpI family protein [Spirochaetota bacterium]